MEHPFECAVQPTTVKEHKLTHPVVYCWKVADHLRKQGDSDPLNKLSGTTGISGAVDAVLGQRHFRCNGTGY